MNIKDVKQVDLACGTNKKEGFFGVDIDEYEGVDHVQDLRFTPLPFENKQLDHVYASHFLEHLTFEENIYLFNEVYRCLKVGGTFEIVTPHAMSYASDVDLSHKTRWTEDTFGYFSPDNKYFYSWFYEDPKTKERIPVINKWIVKSNDSTPPWKSVYTTEGWMIQDVKLREIHAFLEKI